MNTIFHRGLHLDRVSGLVSSLVHLSSSPSGTATIMATYLLKSPLECKPGVGKFKALKIKAWEDESRMATMDSTKVQYHNAGPIQYPSTAGIQEKQPITAAARMVLCVQLILQ